MLLNFSGLGWVLMLVFGIWTLRWGKFYLAPNCMVQGQVARVIGWLFVVPLAICFFADTLVAAAFGKDLQNETTRVIVHGVALGVALLCPEIAVALALGFGRPPGSEKMAVEEEDELDEEEEETPSPTFRIIRRNKRGKNTDDRFRE
jgi:hypothetical protein